MRVVNKPEELTRAFQAAQAEAKSTFGHDGVYLERYFLEPRHIEVQIVADNRGHVVHLGERDCSIQRRHQKLVEETPSPAIDERLRREIGRTAVEAVKAIRYCNVGTVEFLLDKDRNFFFMEVNTRIQVEHPITEMVTGIDLVKEQIRIASGMPLSFKQPDIKLNGHSFECRINAEDPENLRPARGRSQNIPLPADWASGSIPPWNPMLRSCPITIRSLPNSSPTVVTGRKPWLGCAGPWMSSSSRDQDHDSAASEDLQRSRFPKGHVSTTFLDRFLAGQSS